MKSAVMVGYGGAVGVVSVDDYGKMPGQETVFVNYSLNGHKAEVHGMGEIRIEMPAGDVLKGRLPVASAEIGNESPATVARRLARAYIGDAGFDPTIPQTFFYGVELGVCPPYALPPEVRVGIYPA